MARAYTLIAIVAALAWASTLPALGYSFLVAIAFAPFAGSLAVLLFSVFIALMGENVKFEEAGEAK